MNFFQEYPNIEPNNYINYGFQNQQDVLFKINEINNRLKKLEQRITRLENQNNNSSNNEPDGTLYMI